jgi:hypothetical protein
MVQHGEDFEVRRAGKAVAVVMGLYRQRKRYVGFLPYVDVQQRDVLRRKLTDQELVVTAIDIQSVRGLPPERQAYFASAKARRRPQNVKITVHPTFASTVGVGGNTWSASFDFRSINDETARRGGRRSRS